MVAASLRRMSSFFAIDRFRVLEHRLDYAPDAILEPLKKTPLPAGMTGDASRLFHDQQNRIVVAVEPDFANLLHMARLLTLLPEPPARARPVVREPRLRRARKRISIHPSQSEHLFPGCVLGDRRRKAFAVPFDAVEPIVHVLTGWLVRVAHFDAGGGHGCLGLTDREFAIVEYRGGEHRISTSLDD